MKKAGLLSMALMALLLVAVFLPAVTPSVLALSCFTEIYVTLSAGGSPVKEIRAGTPVVISAEYDGNCTNAGLDWWVVEIRNSDGFVEHRQWRSILPTESLPYEMNTQWTPLRAGNYEIKVRFAYDLAAAYCSGIDIEHSDHLNCKLSGPPVYPGMDWGSGKANLVVRGELKGILHNLQVVDRFDVDATFTKVPVNLDSTVQVTVKRLHWPTDYPSFLTFEIYDSKGKLVQSKLVHEPVKRGLDELVRPNTLDTFYGVDWIPSKAGKYTIKATLTDSLTEPKMSSHIVKKVRVVDG